jgi:hypothetical protein
MKKIPPGKKPPKISKETEELLNDIFSESRMGVDFSVRHGAVCPSCGIGPLKTYCTKPWEGTTRIRYHKCANNDCLLCHINFSIKSIQADYSEMGKKPHVTPLAR